MEKLVAVGNNEEKLWGTFAHLSAVAGFVFPLGNIFGPLLIWLLKRNESSFVDANGKNSLNFQISMTIYMVAAGFMSIFIIGIPVLIGLGILNIILVIKASIEANNGKAYQYPLSIVFIK